jgi:putative hydrolase of the HAD superfamily
MTKFNFRDIKGVFFDLYGTVLVFEDEEKASQEWKNAYYDMVGVKNNLSRDTINNLCAELLQNNVVKDKTSGLTTYETKIKQSFEKLGIIFSREELKFLADESVGIWQRYISLAPDAEHVFNQLRRNIKLAMITNFDHSPHIHKVIRKYNLDSFLEPIVISDEAGVLKPDPKIFELTLEQTNLKANEIIFVGDSSDDINGALFSKIEPVLIKYSKSRNNINLAASIQKSFTTITSLSELLDLLNNN